MKTITTNIASTSNMPTPMPVLNIEATASHELSVVVNTINTSVLIMFDLFIL